MDKAKRAQTAETPKQPSLGLKLRAPYLYPDWADSARVALSRLQDAPDQSASAHTVQRT
jgi:hypothetical protein